MGRGRELGDPEGHLGARSGGGLDDEAEVVAIDLTQPGVDVAEPHRVPAVRPVEDSPDLLWVRAGAVVLPPQAKPSMLTRDVISQSIRKIEADRIIEETMRIDAIDLIYRPVYAHRLKWQGKETVVEVDAVLGETKTAGTTFENYVGKLVDRELLLDAGLEAADMYLRGETQARIIVSKAAKFNAKT